MIRNFNCIKKCFKELIVNHIFLVLSAFHNVKPSLAAISSNYDSNRISKSPACSSSESPVSSFKVVNNNEVYFKKTNLKLQAIEEIQFIESDSQNRTRSGKIERTLSLEVNKTESWSVNSE